MFKVLWFLLLMGVTLLARSQPKKQRKNQFRDSMLLLFQKEPGVEELPVVGFNENERIASENTLPSLLTANRDILINTAGFHFNITRFRFRGYDNTCFSAELNGLPMNAAEDGATQWHLWSGLNDVTRNTQASAGLRATEFAFGNIGNTVSIDTRASRQRVQTQFGYTISNRSFTHRWLFTHSTGLNKKGWAFSFSGNIRFAEEGYTPGSFYDGKSYFIAIDKKINDQELLSFTIFGAPVNNGKQSPVLAACVELTGTPYYNAYWGYQAGKKRNANTRSQHQPVMILRYDRQPDNHTVWTTAIGMVIGYRADTGLDWYKAADPRPDYYRYLPSYQQDSLLKQSVAAAIAANPGLLQINWNHLYEVNRNSNETVADANGIAGHQFSGKRAHYIIEKRIAVVKRFLFNTAYHTLLPGDISFSSGASLQWQQTHYYKKLDDLLGADFYVDWNQFAERDFPNDPLAIQNDLDRPNRIVFKNDELGYNYMVRTLQAKGWMQVNGSRKKLDYFAGAELCYTNYQREGLVKNGLFPGYSFGRSALNEFTGIAAKAGVTYKFNGRKFLYGHIGFFSKAPLFDNVFISPKTRDQQQEIVKQEKIVAAEAGYILNAPTIKCKLSAYTTAFFEGMNISSFYHDAYGNFVNYALSGIGKTHFGLESGTEISLSEKISVIAVASIGRYYYNNRQVLIVSADNNASVIERGLIYSKNFRVEGTPQEAYALGINYQSTGFYAGLTGSYFRQHWLAFNPLRRTYAALEGVMPGSDQWKEITGQWLLPAQYVLDLSLGGSIKLKMIRSKKKQLLLFNASINNLLNNRELISGGYEQLRFDTDTKSTAKFPPKFFYTMGLNFSFSINFRLW